MFRATVESFTTPQKLAKFSQNSSRNNKISTAGEKVKIFTNQDFCPNTQINQVRQRVVSTTPCSVLNDTSKRFEVGRWGGSVNAQV